jgi:glycosyltransferase involved in cell wall biosynthesis
LAGIPYTVRAHAYDIYAPYGWAAVVLGSSSTVMAISEDGQRHISDVLGVKSEIVRVGVPIPEIPRRSAGPAGMPFRLLSVGALVPKKGHDAAIAAVRDLVASGTSVSLDIFGEGPERDRLSRLSQGAPVRLRGRLPTSDLRRQYQHYDALLMTSRIASDNDRDGIPVVIMEAMAAQLPVASTIVGGMRELVIDGETGIVLPDDPAGIARGLRRLISDYPRAFDRTRSAMALIERQFELSAVVTQLISTWEPLIHSRRTANSSSPC